MKIAENYTEYHNRKAEEQYQKEKMDLIKKLALRGYDELVLNDYDKDQLDLMYGRVLEMDKQVLADYMLQEARRKSDHENKKATVITVVENEISRQQYRKGFETFLELHTGDYNSKGNVLVNNASRNFFCTKNELVRGMQADVVIDLTKGNKTKIKQMISAETYINIKDNAETNDFFDVVRELGEKSV